MMDMRAVARCALLALVGGTLCAAAPGHAVVLGGGAADKDCRVAFEGVDATAGASGVVCVDGDPACDGDGAADGSCLFAPSLCVGVALANCNAVALDRLEQGGAVLAAPALPAADGSCGAPGAIAVPADTAVATTVRAYLGQELREVDYLNLCCVTEAGPFDAAACAMAADLAASGCATVPARATRKLAKAGERVGQAEATPDAARKPLRKAAKLAGKVRAAGQKVARRNDCGFALGLIGNHAQAVTLELAP